MDVMSVGRRSARKMAAWSYLLERARQEIVAATARLLQPTGIFVPIRVVV